MNYKDFFKREAVMAKLKDAPTGNVDEKELAMGIKDEMKDHTVDQKAAETIARQHLKSDPHYYSDMKKCGIGEDEDVTIPDDQKIKDEPTNQPFNARDNYYKYQHDVRQQKRDRRFYNEPVPVGHIDEVGGEEGIPKFPDGSLAAPRGKGVVSISKIVCPGAALSTGKSASGDLSGYKSVSSAGDVENITAAGEVSPGVASKSVGGPVSPGEGQKQGGPNTKGCIADTPKNSRIESGTADATALFENKKASRNFVKKVIHEVMDEMSNECSSYKVGGRSYRVQKDNQASSAQYEPEVTENQFASMNPDNPDAQTPSGQAGMVHKTSTICPHCNGSGEGMADGTKCRHCKGSGDERGWGKPKTLPSRMDPDYDPRDQGIDEGRCEDYPCCGHEPGDCPDHDKSGNEIWRCASCRAKLPKGASSSLCPRCLKRAMDDPDGQEDSGDFQESAPPGFGPGKEHDSIYKKVKAQYPGSPSKAYATMWKIHNKIAEGSLVQENGKWVQKTVEEKVDMKMGPSYKVVSPTQAQCSDEDSARAIQYDPQVTEAGGAAVQHSSFRTANYAPQTPKNRHRGDID